MPVMRCLKGLSKTDIAFDNRSRLRLFPLPRLTAPVSTPLSILDATVARFSPTGAVWLFCSPSTSHATLQSSFIATLNDFPQWAGQLQWSPVRDGGLHTERFGRPMVVYGCDSDPGVEWVVSKVERTVDSVVPSALERVAGSATWIATDFPQNIFLSDTKLALHNLVEYAGLPGMSVQTTEFACGGYAIAVKMAHPLADAQSLMVFMHQWATACNGFAKSPMGPPIFNPGQLDSHAVGDIDRDVADPSFVDLARLLPLHRFDWWNDAKDPAFPSFLNPTSQNSKPPPPSENSKSLLPFSPSTPAPWSTWDFSRPVSQAILHFTEEQLSSLRTSTRELPGCRPDISRLDALLEHIWSAINRARGYSHSADDVFLNVTLSARTRVQPPLSDSFIGSPIFLTHIRSSGSEASVPALGTTASAIRETLTMFTPEKMGAMLHDAAFERSPQRLWQAFLGDRHTLVTSWLRLNIYDVDFGGGIPSTVFFLSTIINYETLDKMGSNTVPLPPTTHKLISPAIYYWGTPVVIISTTNPDTTTNIAPMSSAWWLGNHCMLGLAANSQTTVNLRRTKQCVLNLASDDMERFVNALARTTGSEGLESMPGDARYAFKCANGYKYVHDKFKHSGLTQMASEIVEPTRVVECPVQMEAELVAEHEMMVDTEKKGRVLALEVKVVRTHVHDGVRMEGFENRIDPDKWRPMIMSFQQLYGLAPKRIADSVLGKIPEEAYKSMSNDLETRSVVRNNK
ncbi:hypothetical protein V496_10675 [Pseudogymnoascus sp. VKM F-4515 (FW-2607)]|nr:hypothetical protein V496_10675 [Pseudogymnoascus sp. VKM F-4515 (FW-2607)]